MSEIKGYRTLKQTEIDCINEIKVVEEEIKDKITTFFNFYYIQDADQRMLALARTNIEQGFMWLIKSIAKPE